MDGSEGQTRDVILMQGRPVNLTASRQVEVYSLVMRSQRLTQLSPALLSVVVVLVILVTGCGSDGEGNAAKAKPSTESPSAPAEETASSPAEVPSSVAPPPMTVSLSTTCDLLFTMKPKPLFAAVDLVNKKSMDERDLATATDLEDSFANIEATAPQEVQPFIEAQRQAMQDIIDSFAEGSGSVTRDLQAFRASGLELIQQCT